MLLLECVSEEKEVYPPLSPGTASGRGRSCQHKVALSTIEQGCGQWAESPSARVVSAIRLGRLVHRSAAVRSVWRCEPAGRAAGSQRRSTRMDPCARSSPQAYAVLSTGATTSLGHAQTMARHPYFHGQRGHDSKTTSVYDNRHVITRITPRRVRYRYRYRQLQPPA